MTRLSIRAPLIGERGTISALVESAFGKSDEASLVERLAAEGDAVLELVAERDGRLAGHVLFSRLIVDDTGNRFAAVALAPLAVEPELQRTGVGTALVEEAHRRLQAFGEALSIVVGDPAYYGRFGYAHDRAALFDSDYQCDAMQALAWGKAPAQALLIYAPAFGSL